MYHIYYAEFHNNGEEVLVCVFTVCTITNPLNVSFLTFITSNREVIMWQIVIIFLNGINEGFCMSTNFDIVHT